MKTDWAITVKGKVVEVEIKLPYKTIFTRITPKRKPRSPKRSKRK